MLKHTLLSVLIVALCHAACAKDERYKLFEVAPNSRQQMKLLAALTRNEHDYDYFQQPSLPEQKGLVMVASSNAPFFERSLNTLGIAHRLLQEDVHAMLEAEVREFHLQRLLKPYMGMQRLTTDRYYTHAEIHAYIEDLAKRFPQRAFVKTVGRSYEGRLLKTLTISNGDGRANKNVVLMDGGFHAREWISTAAVLYIIEQLVENYEQNAELLLDYDWVVLPVVNPDGYEYSQLNASTRLWRKTRKPSSATCIGSDPNRNFDFHWNEEGASQNPCASTYAGPYAFSEPEALVVGDLIRSYSNRGIMYLTMHSHGRMILYPWGWTEDLPDTWEDLHDVAKAGEDAIRAYNGTEYRIGSSTNVLYVASGAADDYAFNEGFPISFTMELPAGGPNNFDVPPNLIDWYVKETWAGVRAMAKRCTVKYPLRRR